MLILICLIQGTEHSGIAILYPHKGPKFYNDPFREGVYQEEPQDAIELDRFCTNEQQQKRELIGAETWQLATLNRYLVSYLQARNISVSGMTTSW